MGFRGGFENSRTWLWDPKPETQPIRCSYFSFTLAFEGNEAEAEKLLRRTLDIERRILGSNPGFFFFFLLSSTSFIFGLAIRNSSLCQIEVRSRLYRFPLLL